MLGFPLIPSIARLILLLVVYDFDTPKYLLCVKGDEESSREVLKKIY